MDDAQNDNIDRKTYRHLLQSLKATLTAEYDRLSNNKAREWLHPDTVHAKPSNSNVQAATPKEAAQSLDEGRSSLLTRQITIHDLYGGLKRKTVDRDVTIELPTHNPIDRAPGEPEHE